MTTSPAHLMLRVLLLAVVALCWALAGAAAAVLARIDGATCAAAVQRGHATRAFAGGATLSPALLTFVLAALRIGRRHVRVPGSRVPAARYGRRGHGLVRGGRTREVRRPRPLATPPGAPLSGKCVARRQWIRKSTPLEMPDGSPVAPATSAT